MRVFVDTNVLVYARDRADPAKQDRAADWMSRLWRGRTGRLSQQVLSEYYVTVTRKLDPGLSPEEARADVRDLAAWSPVVIDVPLVEEAWVIEDRYRLSFWDALVVGAARAAGCEVLLTEDLQAGQDLGGVVVVNPFEGDPASILG